MSVLWQLVAAFAVLSVVSFGGGLAMLPELERVSSLDHSWVPQSQFAQLYSLGQLAPGPNGIMVVLVGYRAAGYLGALATLVAFFLPSTSLSFSVGRAWRRLAGSPWSEAIHHGLAPFTIGLMLAGVISLARSALFSPGTVGIAAGVAAMVMLGKTNPALLVLGGGLIGWFVC